MKPKVLDFDVDKQRIIDEALAFMVDEGVEVGSDFRQIYKGSGNGPKKDTREAMFKSLVQNLAQN